MEKQILVRKTLREQVVDVLREKMLRGVLKPGERLIEADISEEFRISRGPIREALRQLEEEGLLTYEPHKGCIVKTLSYRDMLEASMLRAELEVLAVRVYGAKLCQETREKLEEQLKNIGKAAEDRDLYEIEQGDEKFHGLIVAESGCQRLYRMWQSLEGANAATYYTMSSRDQMPYNVLEYNHRIIYDSFAAEDPAEVEKMIREHYTVVPEVFSGEWDRQHSGQ